MRHGRLFITMLAALAVMAVGPAYAAAATSSVVDDSAADFGAGTTTATAAVAPGSVRLDSVEPFDGTTLPADFAIEQQFDPAGTATAATGSSPCDAALVHSVHELVPDQVLEFRGTFGTTAALQHAGLAGVAPGSLNGAGPWAIFSTGSSGGGLWRHLQRSGAADPDHGHAPRLRRERSAHVPHRMVRERRELLRRRHVGGGAQHHDRGPDACRGERQVVGRRRRRHRLARRRHLPTGGRVRVARARHRRTRPPRSASSTPT